MLSIVLCLLGLIIRFSCCRWISLTILESLRTLSTKTVSSNTIFNWLALTVNPPPPNKPPEYNCIFWFYVYPKSKYTTLPPSATRSLFPTFALQERFILSQFSLVQSADIIVNKPFQDRVWRLFVEHLYNSLSKISVSKRVLTGRWVGA